MAEFSQTKGAEILTFDASHKSFMMDLGPAVLEHLAIKAKVNHDFSEGCQIKLVDSGEQQNIEWMIEETHTLQSSLSDKETLLKES